MIGLEIENAVWPYTHCTEMKVGMVRVNYGKSNRSSVYASDVEYEPVEVLVCLGTRCVFRRGRWRRRKTMQLTAEERSLVLQVVTWWTSEIDFTDCTMAGVFVLTGHECKIEWLTKNCDKEQHVFLRNANGNRRGKNL